MAIQVDAGEPFEISIVGETSGSTWAGAFRCKTKLSFKEQLLMDKIRRELLGPDAANASEMANIQARVLAELAVRLVDAPTWWKESKAGLDLCDENVLVGIWEKTQDILAAKATRSQEETRSAVEELRQLREAQSKKDAVE